MTILNLLTYHLHIIKPQIDIQQFNNGDLVVDDGHQSSIKVLNTSDQISMQQNSNEDIVVVEDDHQSNFKALNTNDQISLQQNNKEDIVVIENNKLSSNLINSNQSSVVEKIDNQLQDYRSKRSIRYTEYIDVVVMENGKKLSSNLTTSKQSLAAEKM